MTLLELDCDFNNISVRSFILTGAPFWYSSANLESRHFGWQNDDAGASMPGRMSIDHEANQLRMRPRRCASSV
jgi:hypothetical protein